VKDGTNADFVIVVNCDLEGLLLLHQFIHDECHGGGGAADFKQLSELVESEPEFFQRRDEQWQELGSNLFAGVPQVESACPSTRTDTLLNVFGVDLISNLCIKIVSDKIRTGYIY
jgi:hypothetical protein